MGMFCRGCLLDDGVLLEDDSDLGVLKALPKIEARCGPGCSMEVGRLGLEFELLVGSLDFLAEVGFGAGPEAEDIRWGFMSVFTLPIDLRFLFVMKMLKRFAL